MAPQETGESEVTEGVKREGQDTGAQKPKESSPTRTNKLSQRVVEDKKRPIDTQKAMGRLTAGKMSANRAPSNKLEKDADAMQ